ncbi:MAG TPA: class II aldolase/adducin family protein [Terriglobales bacterium]|nr:class II aldolase/adducin family protein [Terriglobales bacterium]
MHMQIEEQLLEACRHLAGQQFLNTPEDSCSMRVPGCAEMIFATGLHDWHQVRNSDLHRLPLSVAAGSAALHATVYGQRDDVGAVVISSPRWARLLRDRVAVLPPLFDEQVRHIGKAACWPGGMDGLLPAAIKNALRSGANAALIGERLMCLGTTRDRAVFNTELFEKCAQAFVLAQTTGKRISLIPVWVRFIANRRLLKDERRAAESYRAGRIPEGMNAY